MQKIVKLDKFLLPPLSINMFILPGTKGFDFSDTLVVGRALIFSATISSRTGDGFCPPKCGAVSNLIINQVVIITFMISNVCRSRK